MNTIAQHPELSLAGVYDRDPKRSLNFNRTYSGTKIYDTYEQLLTDPAVSIVLNLTNPHEHYTVSRAALAAGKHVYSEKPLATDFDHARELVDFARQRGVHISSAPCSVLGSTAQTVWKAMRDRIIGTPYVVYAELDDGMVHRMAYDKWISRSGIAWPWKDEFEVGCTMEHAGYYLTWFGAMFGPAESVTAFASAQVDDKKTAVPLDRISPDLTVACIKYKSGPVVRLTCSIIAPHDHQLRIIGEEGVLSVEDCWYYRNPVKVRKWITIRRKTLLHPIATKLPLLGKDVPVEPKSGSAQMDFMRGVGELADAIHEGRMSRLSPEFCLHMNELTLAIHHGDTLAMPYRMKTTFEPMQPLMWKDESHG